MRRLTLTAAVAAALLAPLLATLPASADTPSTAVFVPTGDWGSGFQGEYNITAGTGGLTSWKLEFDLPAGASLSSVWDADYTRSGDHYTLVNKSWNGALAAGASVKPGFVGAPGGGVVPINCELNDAPCAGGPAVDQKPLAPTGLAASNITTTGVKLSWQAGSDDKGVASYNVYRGGVKVKSGVTALTTDITGLSAGTNYSFAVSSVDTIGQESAPSPAIAVKTATTVDTTAPSVPTGLAAGTITADSVALTWTASTDNSGTVAGYNVFRNGVKVGTATGTSYTDNGLTASTVYKYKVSAFDAVPNTSAATAEISATTKATDPPPSSFQKIGYFTQWGIYGRNFKVKDLDTSGAARNMTTINYAFGNVSQDGKCFTVNQTGVGDSFADYSKGFGAAESVDGVADAWDQPLKGNFNQLKKLKAKHPGLKAYISLGGWTWSKYFSNAALTDASRKAFVSSCIDLYLKGNLPVYDSAGGPGAAAGVFDGIDIDWEWPGSTSGDSGNVVRPEDKQNFTLLLAEFRRQLDAYGATAGKRYGLTFFLPANPHEVEVGLEVDKIHQYLDYGNLQGYDFHGRWETKTGADGNLYDIASDPSTPDKKYSVDKAVKLYTGMGFPKSKLTVGMPMYGFGWTGVPAGANNGLWQTSTGLAPSSIPGETGTDNYKAIKNLPGTVYRDPAGTVWKYDGNTFWTYMDPQLATMKADYIKAQGLAGAMYWSLDGDDSTASLSTAVANVLR